MEQEKVLEVFYDHYKETCALCKDAQIRRNRSFVILCILEALSLLMIWNSQFITAILNDVVRNQIESTVKLGSNVIQTLIWILIAYLFVRYVQEVIYIERQYDYLNTLEEKIGEFLGNDVLSREGKNYLKDYPLVLDIIHAFYNFLCPIFFIAINIIHIVLEYRNKIGTLPIIADTILVFSISIITLFYFLEIHKGIRNRLWKVKPIAWVDRILRK